MPMFEQAQALIQQFKGDRYLNGFGVLSKAGELAAPLGKRAALVHSTFRGTEPHIRTILDSLKAAGVELAGTIKGAAPNAPREDLARITKSLIDLDPDVIVSFGGGSTIDCTKAAETLRTLGGKIDDYFGTSADFWMNLQTAYELDLARQKIGADIRRIPKRNDKPAKLHAV